MVAEGFEDFVVVAVFGEVEVAVHAEAGEDLGGDGAAAPLSPLVVLSLLPCGKAAPRRHGSILEGSPIREKEESMKLKSENHTTHYTLPPQSSLTAFFLFFVLLKLGATSHNHAMQLLC